MNAEGNKITCQGHGDQQAEEAGCQLASNSLPVSLNADFLSQEQQRCLTKTPALCAKVLSILLFKGIHPNLVQYQFPVSFTSALIVSFAN